jgi:hypothetical protein
MSNDAVVRALLNGILSDAKPSPEEFRKTCARDLRKWVLAEFTLARLQDLAVDIWQKNFEPLVQGAEEEALAALRAGDQQGATSWANMAESSRRERDFAIRLIKTPFCGSKLYEKFLKQIDGLIDAKVACMEVPQLTAQEPRDALAQNVVELLRSIIGQTQEWEEGTQTGAMGEEDHAAGIADPYDGTKQEPATGDQAAEQSNLSPPNDGQIDADVADSDLGVGTLIPMQPAAEAQAAANSAPKQRRRCYDRDHDWLAQYEAGKGLAAIRDEWNSANAKNPVKWETVKKGVAKAKKEREAGDES